jgi:hypothetical protein
MNKGDSLLFRMTGIELMHHVIEMRDPRAKMLPPPTWWIPVSFKNWTKAASSTRCGKNSRRRTNRPVVLTVNGGAPRASPWHLRSTPVRWNPEQEPPAKAGA